MRVKAHLFTIIICYILNLIVGTKVSVNELKHIVSKNETLNWLDSFNEAESSKNPYCHLCCIQIASETIGKHCGSHTLCKFPVGLPYSTIHLYFNCHFTLDKSNRTSL